MGDFLIKLGTASRTDPTGEERLLSFSAKSRLASFTGEGISISLVRPDGFELWGPYQGEGREGPVWIGLAGRVALSASEWEGASNVAGAGGRACKALFSRFSRGGVSAVATVSGNYAILIHEARARRLHVVTDPLGAYLAYSAVHASGDIMLGSHPDVLAAMADQQHNLDEVSLGEFLRTGRVSHPFTYYRGVTALPFGQVITYELSPNQPPPRPVVGARSVAFSSRIDPHVSEAGLVEELAVRLGDSVRRRTLPILGPTGLGLSGGLDSRALLAAVAPDAQVQPFFLLDRDNAECQVARAIAKAAGLPLIEIQRDFEYYGKAAAEGVRISGGMGSMASNHYLGAWPELESLGVSNLVTGCYCDYLFKALAVNRTEHRFLRNEQLGAFRLPFYRPFYPLAGPLQKQVGERLRSTYGVAEGGPLTDDQWLSVETKRTFPLAREADLAQRSIPQRVMPWSPPLVDTPLLELHQQIPARMKLNATLFRKAMTRLCPATYLAVPDNNTGAPVNAGELHVTLSKYRTALKNRLTGWFQPGVASRGSWPNWAYYVKHSEVIAASWRAGAADTTDMLARLIGHDPLQKQPAEYGAADLEFFLRLWTLKLWLDQRR